ncbi:hypothetical protein [Clostridium paraputrificum]|uniref:hypothetical protein n=1 Tax=Clostridium paraputrificum TaxID=29363 RepID=UPI0006655355|nr:hypothetical protein [Clostridium paraputrificum]MDB2106609.1 hypothetical protein [Clostridium paraputrificum]MDB2113322.1 hypothetical protein [Clostridium paraputrificum]
MRELIAKRKNLLFIIIGILFITFGRTLNLYIYSIQGGTVKPEQFIVDNLFYMFLGISLIIIGLLYKFKSND